MMTTTMKKAVSTATMNVPRLFSKRLLLQKQAAVGDDITTTGSSTTTNALDIVEQWLSSSGSSQKGGGWSPQEIMKDFESSSTRQLSIKRSKNRFFMYEEMEGGPKLQDLHGGPTETINASPMEFANLLENNNNNNDYYYYWTSPISSISPGFIKERQMNNYTNLVSNNNNNRNNNNNIDPRGPSLWMASNGSATQAHYDVADNIMIQLYGSKRIRLYEPSDFLHLCVFPDAHPRARKSQLNFDNDNGTHDYFPTKYNNPKFDINKPYLDVVLNPGDLIEIPAFWFHHIENGTFLPEETTTNFDFDFDFDASDRKIIDGPSVSLNIFSLSQPMLFAQDIFQQSSLSLRRQFITTSSDRQEVVSILRELSYSLIEGLLQRQQQQQQDSSSTTTCGGGGLLSSSSSPRDIIETCLLETRYRPLLLMEKENNKNINNNNNSSKNNECNQSSSSSSSSSTSTTKMALLPSQKQQIHDHIDQELMPKFDSILTIVDPNPNSIVLIVACHLIELWAVQLVEGNPNQVYQILEEVCRRRSRS